MKLENALQKARREKGVLIAAHRGVSGGNIPFSTKKAFDAALCQGADILETDITASRDGTLFIFHPKQEHQFCWFRIGVQDRGFTISARCVHREGA